MSRATIDIFSAGRFESGASCGLRVKNPDGFSSLATRQVSECGLILAGGPAAIPQLDPWVTALRGLRPRRCVPPPALSVGFSIAGRPDDAIRAPQLARPGSPSFQGVYCTSEPSRHGTIGNRKSWPVDSNMLTSPSPQVTQASLGPRTDGGPATHLSRLLGFKWPSSGREHRHRDGEGSWSFDPVGGLPNGDVDTWTGCNAMGSWKLGTLIHCLPWSRGRLRPIAGKVPRSSRYLGDQCTIVILKS